MRLSTSTNIQVFDEGVPNGISMEDSIRICAERGYHYLDANLCGQCRIGAPLAADDWEAWLQRIEHAVDTYGVQILQSHGYYPIGYTFDSDNKRSDGAYGEEMMRRSVLVSEALGVRWMVVHPQSVRNADGSVDHQRSFSYNVATYKNLALFCEQHHLGIAIENMILPSYGGEITDLLALKDAIGMENAQICIDTGHANVSGFSVPEVLSLVGKSLKATHIADNHGQKDEHLPPCFGNIPWKEIMKTLRQIDYQEDFSFEIQNFTRPFPKEIQGDLVAFSYQLGTWLCSLVS